MLGVDAPTALFLLLGGMAAVAMLSMRRLGRSGTGDDADSDADAGRAGGYGRPRLGDRRSILVGGLVILGAVVASLVVLGLWP